MTKIKSCVEFPHSYFIVLKNTRLNGRCCFLALVTGHILQGRLDCVSTQMLKHFGTGLRTKHLKTIINRFLNGVCLLKVQVLFNNKKTVDAKAPTAFLVGVTGLEPAASCSQSRRATSCATPRNSRYLVKVF